MTFTPPISTTILAETFRTHLVFENSMVSEIFDIWHKRCILHMHHQLVSLVLMVHKCTFLDENNFEMYSKHLKVSFLCHHAEVLLHFWTTTFIFGRCIYSLFEFKKLRTCIFTGLRNAEVAFLNSFLQQFNTFRSGF